MRPKGTTYQSPRTVRIKMAHAINRFEAGDPDWDLETFKAYIYALTQVLSALRLEKDQREQTPIDSGGRDGV